MITDAIRSRRSDGRHEGAELLNHVSQICEAVFDLDDFFEFGRCREGEVLQPRTTALAAAAASFTKLGKYFLGGEGTC